MNKKTNELIEEIKKISKNYSEIETAILFGSVARDQAEKESDIDVCIILKNDDTKSNISNKILDLEEKYDKNIDLIFTGPSFKKLDRQFIETILLEGITIYGKNLMLRYINSNLSHMKLSNLILAILINQEK